jgi:hypothetical protein
MASLLDLGDDVLGHILYLSPVNIRLRIGLLCKKLNTLMRYDTVWNEDAKKVRSRKIDPLQAKSVASYELWRRYTRDVQFFNLILRKDTKTQSRILPASLLPFSTSYTANKIIYKYTVSGVDYDIMVEFIKKWFPEHLKSMREKDLINLAITRRVVKHELKFLGFDYNGMVDYCHQENLGSYDGDLEYTYDFHHIIFREFVVHMWRECGLRVSFYDMHYMKHSANESMPTLKDIYRFYGKEINNDRKAVEVPCEFQNVPKASILRIFTCLPFEQALLQLTNGEKKLVFLRIVFVDQRVTVKIKGSKSKLKFRLIGDYDIANRVDICKDILSKEFDRVNEAAIASDIPRMILEDRTVIYLI